MASMPRATTTTYSVMCGSQIVFTTVTTSPSAVHKWIRETLSRAQSERDYYDRGSLAVGLGVQWIPGGGRCAATLQLCAGERCLIYHLHRVTHAPFVLHDFLGDPNVIFAGVWNYMDAAMLWESRHRLVVRQLVDLRDVARDRWGCDRNASMGKLVSEILGMEGMEGDEAVLRSNWEAEELTFDQVKYACCDAYLSHRMAIELEVWRWGR